MSTDETLWADPARGLPAGRMRHGLDVDVAAARDAGSVLSASGIAALETLADHIDHLERQLRSPAARPYDRVPLAGLIREFRETMTDVLAADTAAEDPLAAAFREFSEAER